MVVLKGKVTSAKEQGGLVWLHISGWAGSGWISLSKNLFVNVYTKRLIKQLYGKHNRIIEKRIKKLQYEIKLAKKEKKEHAVMEREYHIHALKGQLKKELHMHDLIGKKIYLRIT